MLVRLISVGTLVANVVLIAVVVYVRAEIAAVSLISKGAAVAPLTGVTIEGEHIGTRDALRAKCHLVRYSSTACALSNSDRRPWNTVAAAAANRLGCEVTIISPGPDRMPAIDGMKVNRLAYPVMTFVGQTRFRGTPTTLLFDEQWRLVWWREGPLQDDDQSALLRAAPEL
jgi:hypothetical protein